jgi:hypothetical protein
MKIARQRWTETERSGCVGASLTVTGGRARRSLASRAPKIRRREADGGAENASKCITTVDNVMTHA